MTDFRILVSDKRTDGSIKNWANNDLIPATSIVAQAQQLIYRGGVGPRAVPLRVRQMTQVATGTMSTSARTLSLPARHLQGRHLMITGTNKHKLTQKTPEFVEGCLQYDGDGNEETGLPDYWCDTDVITMNCKPSEAYPYRYMHLAEFAPLSEAAPTNFLTDHALNALHAACMARVFSGYPRDEKERTYWMTELDAHIAKLNMENQLSQVLADVVMEVR